MSGVNKWIGIGNLTKDVETRTLESGAKVSSFTIACNENYKNRDGERVETVEFILIVLWKGLAEVAEKYLKKGDKVYIEGKIKTRSWESEGVTKYATEIIGNHMKMLGGNDNKDV